MKGRCKYCNAPVILMDGSWRHDGLAGLVHIIKHMRDTKEATA